MISLTVLTQVVRAVVGAKVLQGGAEVTNENVAQNLRSRVMRLPAGKIFFILGIGTLSLAANAQETVCAKVKIEIKQELTLERQGFDAQMKISNTTTTGVIEDVGVTVKVTDENGAPVAISFDPNDTSAKFFIRVSNKENINAVDGTGTVNPASTAVIDWLLIPAPGAAGSSPLGKKFLVGATLRYRFGGDLQSLDVSPDVITVKPLPLLTLDYFLTRDVNADNPLTEQIEPVEPYTLGVRVKNTGMGIAHDVKIDSAQPKIIENNQGLLINFLIDGSYVNDAPVQNSLLINFGDINPSASKVGRWVMESSLSGTFTEFSAKFTHSDELGGALTSILQATNAHSLIRDVRVDLPGRDMVRDFLAQDGDVVRVYESEGLDTIATDRSSVAVLSAQSSSNGVANYSLQFPPTAGFIYVKLPDPFGGSKAMGEVLRSDAKAMLPENAWLSKTRNEQTHSYDYWVNFFDVNSPGTYSAKFIPPPVVALPPQIQFVPDQTLREGHQVSFVVEASSSAGNPVTLSAAPLPAGAHFVQEPANPQAPGSARAFLDWSPSSGQAGSYLITYTASDGSLASTRSATITVQVPPKMPAVPAIIDPILDASVQIVKPTLLVQTGSDPDDPAAKVFFEIYADEGMANLVASGVVNKGVTTGAAGTTSFTPASALNDNTHYWWRARAFDGVQYYSPWANGRFFVNLFNDAPDNFNLTSPASGVEVGTQQPVLTWTNSSDRDGDALTYGVYVYGNAALTQLVTSAEGLQGGVGGSTSWTVDVQLVNHGKYYWKVIATDSHAAQTEAAARYFIVDTSNAAPTNPAVLSPPDGGQTTTATTALQIQNSTDADNDLITYVFELDTVNTFDSGNKRTSGQVIQGGGATTQWTVDQLFENQRYWWRVKAQDGRAESEWAVASFLMNAVNEAPGTPTIHNPGDNSWTGTVQPVLEANPVQDPENDPIQYQFEVYTDAALTQVAAQGASSTTAWQVTPPLADHTTHWWRVRAVDNLSAASQWTAPSVLYVSSGPYQTPTIAITAPGDVVAATVNGSQKTFTITYDANDPNIEPIIALFYSTTNSGYDGTLIVDGIRQTAGDHAGSYVWDVSTLTPGTYYVYGIIHDSVGTSSAYAPGAVVVPSPVPSAPGLLNPIEGSDVATLTPTLVVQTSAVVGDQTSAVEFQVYADEAMSQLVASARINKGVTSAAAGTTSFTIASGLNDNTHYWWRARAANGTTYFSAWVASRFFANQFNDAPDAFNLSDPPTNVEVASMQPVLSWTNSTDRDGDVITYAVFVYTDAALTHLVASASSLPAGDGGASGWMVSPALINHGHYYWKVVAIDSHGAETSSEARSFVVDTSNAAPTAPVLLTPPEGGQTTTSTTALTIQNSTDADSDLLSYVFEIDTVNTFDSVNKRASGPIGEGANNLTAWTVTQLIENQRYWWRVKALDGRTQSPWSVGQFLMNAVNEAPPTPTLGNPANGTWVNTAQPTFNVNPVVDPEGDAVQYEFEIYGDASLVQNVAQGTSPTPSLQISLADKTTYWWRARAGDALGAYSAWSSASLVHVSSGTYVAPTIQVMSPAEPMTATANGSRMIFTINYDANDPNIEPTIALYYSTVDNGYTGTLIASGITQSAGDHLGSYGWDVTDLPVGTYYVYAVISDSMGSGHAYAPGAVVVPPPVPGSIDLVAPGVDTEVATLKPALIVHTSTAVGDAAKKVVFEIYSDEGMANLVASGVVNKGVTTGAAGTTSFTPASALNDNTHYWWRARAFDGVQYYSPWANGRFFVNLFNDAPDNFNLTSPASGVEVGTQQPVLTWTNSSDRDGDALTYGVYVYGNAALTQLVTSAEGLQGGVSGSTSWTVDVQLVNHGKYYWKVIATDSHSAQTEAAARYFIVDTSNAAPTNPAVLSPPDGGQTTTATTALQIQNSTDADNDLITYVFELDTVNTFDSGNKRTSGQVIQGGGATTQWTVDQLVENQRYWWRVKAQDGRAESEWVVASFLMNAVNEAPPAPTVRNPGNKAWTSSVQPVLEANPVQDPEGESVHYEFEVYSNSALTHKVADGTSTTTGWQVSPPLTDHKTYWWHVRAADTFEAQSDWSAVSILYVSSSVYQAPTIQVLTPATPLVPPVVGGQRMFTINYEANDPNIEPTVALYYSTSSSGYSGTLIVDGIDQSSGSTSGSYVWNVTSLPSGTYYVYGVISDSMGSGHAYAAGAVVIPPANPSGSIVVTAAAGLQTTEAGGTATYTVKLGSAPTSDVTVPITSTNPNEGVPNVNSLTFTPQNWNSARTVTVTGVNDCVQDGDKAYQLLSTNAVSYDPNYITLSGAPVSVTNKDDAVETNGSTNDPNKLVCSYKVVATYQITSIGNVTKEFWITSELTNNGPSGVNGVTAILTAAPPGVTITQSTVQFGAVASGETGKSVGVFKVRSALTAAVVAQLFNLGAGVTWQLTSH